MYKNNLLSSLTKYHENNKSELYEKCLRTIDSTPYDENGLLYILPKNTYLLECVHFTICNNASKYHIYLYNKKKTNCTNFIIKLNKTTTHKLLSFFKISSNIKFKTINNNTIMNIIISDKNIAFNDTFYEFENIRQLCEMDFSNDPENLLLMLMIHNITGYGFKHNLCIPNMIIKNNNMTVYNDNNLNKLYNKLHSELKNIYDVNLPIDNIKKILKKCHMHGFDIYKGIPTYNHDTDIVKKFHLDVKRHIYNKYCKNIDMLFDNGCGRLTDLFYWNDAGIKNVFCVEPSKDSIQSGKDRLERVKNKIKSKILVVEGVGDIDWSTEQKYNEIIKHKYDVITFQFTIHYMINNLQTLIKNLLSISKHNTKIIITCMDGNLIHDELNKKDKIEVRNDKNEIIFAISDMPDDNILVYLKGGYGMEHGSIEKIVNISKLIKIFNENGFILKERKPFLEYNSIIKDVMTPTQKNISKYYSSVVFEYK